MNYIERNIHPAILKGLATMPAVFINGPRQAGKSTLVSMIAGKEINAEYVSLDDLSLISYAKSNPAAFLENFRKPLVIDEIQMAPELFISLKQSIDRLRLTGKNPNGQFLLTGSSDISVMPGLAEMLVGRMLLITLFPLSANEVFGNNGNFLSVFFEKEFEIQNSNGPPVYLPDMIRKATFPQLSVDSSIDISQWFSSYLRMLVDRDVRQISSIEKTHELPHLLKVLASRVGGIINDADLARSTGLNHMTLRRYKTLLENVFLIFTLPPWHGNIGKRLVKTPKIYFTDTLLLIFLSGYDQEALPRLNISFWGKIIENFVASELIKQLSSNGSGSLFYFRTSDNKEVDFIVEKRNGDVIGIEVKNSSTVVAADFYGLKILKSYLGEKFKRGFVLYNGMKTLPFETDMIALPISSFLNM